MSTLYGPSSFQRTRSAGCYAGGDRRAVEGEGECRAGVVLPVVDADLIGARGNGGHRHACSGRTGTPHRAADHRGSTGIRGRVEGDVLIAEPAGTRGQVGCGRACLERHAVDGDRRSVEVHRPVHGGGVNGRGRDQRACGARDDRPDCGMCGAGRPRRSREDDRYQKREQRRPDDGVQAPIMTCEHIDWHPAPYGRVTRRKRSSAPGETASRTVCLRALRSNTHIGSIHPFGEWKVRWRERPADRVRSLWDRRDPGTPAVAVALRIQIA